VICGVVHLLGSRPPISTQDQTARDLIADVFDFLYEARSLIIRGKLDIAYPLARRAYESLSLLVACGLDSKLSERWAAGKKVSNSEARRILSSHPKGENEEQLRDLYDFFCKSTHPNRDHVPNRLLGRGNEFTLGAIGRPNLTMLADYSIKTIELWFWFAAFVVSTNIAIISKDDQELLSIYRKASEAARPILNWFREQFNRVIHEERAEMLKSGQIS
jgi:hypothetical protein